MRKLAALHGVGCNGGFGMTHRSYRKENLRDWGTTGSVISLEQINTGAILRIADATEKMAERHTELIRQRDYFEGEVKRLRAIREHLERSNASLRGHLKRAKKMMPNVQVEGAAGGLPPEAPARTPGSASPSRED